MPRSFKPRSLFFLFCLLLGISTRSSAQSPVWAEAGVGFALDQGTCGECGGPNESGFVSLRSAIGFRIRPGLSVALGGDFGEEFDIESTNAHYTIISVMAVAPLPSWPALQGRVGLGGAHSLSLDNENGSGAVGRLGFGLQLPPNGIASAMLTADYFIGLGGHYERTTKSLPDVQSRSGFDFRMLQFGLALRVGR